MLEKFERVRLAQVPTPLQKLPRLGASLGLSDLYVKRDDLTGLELSGNKARKLEFELAKVLKEKADVVLTVGGPQSNHARITAAFARRLGLDVKLVLGGAPPENPQGNLLLDSLLGAEIRYVEDDSNENLLAEMSRWAKELREQGKKPYEIPLGGSTALGAMGYVEAMRELSTESPSKDPHVVVAVGSCGTLAGVVLGAKLFLPEARIWGVSVSRSASDIRQRTIQIADEAVKLLGRKVAFAETDFEILDGYHEGYGTFTPGGKSAIELAARTEGLLLDPVYTGKAMAALVDQVRRKKIGDEPIIFLHTGGAPILFAYASLLLS